MSTSLGNICRFLNGGTPPRNIDRYFEGTIPWITGADIAGPVVQLARTHITSEAVAGSATNVVPAGSILLVTRTSVGKVAIAGVPLAFSQDITAVLPDERKVVPAYLVHFLRNNEATLKRAARGATIKGITREFVEKLTLDLPSLLKQRRVAAILDQADTLRTKRRQALAKLDTLTQSIFLEMFGDPAVNPRSWPMRRLGDLAEKFSDGPFGSNLKSAHYTSKGVRVVRLQNIGVGYFDNMDEAYVSEHHFEQLTKHTCLPGDVLVGTLGDPNLRACIQPKWLTTALNKADCVQIRARIDLATPQFICGLLNQPSTELMAQSMILGQTRSRIAMGRLRELVVPLPPLTLQKKFSDFLLKKEDIFQIAQLSSDELDVLFASLQHRAFRGEL